MAHVSQVRNPEALGVADVRDLFDRAFKTGHFGTPNLSDIEAEVKGIISDQHFGVFVAVEKGKFVGLLVISLPRDKLLTVPQVTIFYCDGSPETKDQLIEKGLDWGVAQGYSKFWAINVSGKPDAAWMKTFAKAGTAKKIGSIMEFTP